MIFTPLGFFFVLLLEPACHVYEYSSRHEAPQRGLVQRLLALAGRVA